MRRNSEETFKDLKMITCWLVGVLSDGPVPLDEIILKSQIKQISRSDLNIARRSLKIVTERKQGISFWRLPCQEV